MFVPANEVEEFWYGTIRGMVTFSELESLAKYMEETWIGKSRGGDN